MRNFSIPSAVIARQISRLTIASVVLTTVMGALTTGAQAADLFPQNKLNSSQQAKIARAISQSRQVGSDGATRVIQNNALGQANAANNTRSNDRSCNNNAANVGVPKGHRGKIDNLTVVKGDVIMVCRTR